MFVVQLSLSLTNTVHDKAYEHKAGRSSSHSQTSGGLLRSDRIKAAAIFFSSFHFRLSFAVYPLRVCTSQQCETGDTSIAVAASCASFQLPASPPRSLGFVISCPALPRLPPITALARASLYPSLLPSSPTPYSSSKRFSLLIHAVLYSFCIDSSQHQPNATRLSS